MSPLEIPISTRRSFCQALTDSFVLGGMGYDTDLKHDRAIVPPLDISVVDFGATGDGKTDDSKAINAALYEARRRAIDIGGYTIGCRIVFPTGVYMIQESLDLTNFRFINCLIEGCGSVIHGRCSGRPVVDALGARWLRVRDLVILGDRIDTPSLGLQIGLLSAHAVADDHHFASVKILGDFTLSCLYNRAAETSLFEHNLFWNNRPDSYCIIQDGLNAFRLSSHFRSETIPAAKDLSFNENSFINCDFRHTNKGVPIWMGDTSRHIFQRCYAATSGREVVYLECGNNSHTMLEFDCHVETDDLDNVFYIHGHGDVVIYGLRYVDHGCFAKSFVFAKDRAVDRVFLSNVFCDIAGFRHVSCRLVDDASSWRLEGDVRIADERHINVNVSQWPLPRRYEPPIK